jgi:hypothetical protein
VVTGTVPGLTSGVSAADPYRYLVEHANGMGECVATMAATPRFRSAERPKSVEKLVHPRRQRFPTSDPSIGNAFLTESGGDDATHDRTRCVPIAQS